MTRALAQAFHPSIFLKEEMQARDWSIEDVAKRMHGPYGINYLSLELYLEIGESEPCLRLGPAAIELAVIFGVDEDFFANLEKTWLDHPNTRALHLRGLNS